MTILLVAATSFEMAPILQHIEKEGTKKSFFEYHYKGLDILPLVTGIGAMRTAFSLARYCKPERFIDLAINLGVAGSNDRSLGLGSVVEVVSDIFADLGVEEQDNTFTDLFQLELEDANTNIYENGIIKNAKRTQNHLKSARGITVNKTHGCASSIERINKKYDFDVESMEGAAFFYCCKSLDIKCMQLRGISNFIEPRNRANWDIEGALGNLTTSLIEHLDHLKNHHFIPLI
jgi:futalosine hydrolase